MEICKTKNCQNKILAKQLCIKCYYRIKRGGTPELSFKEQQALRKCSINNCAKPHFAENFCVMHYRRLRRHGDPYYINPKCNRDGKYKDRHKEYVKQWKKDNRRTYNAYLQSRKDRVKKATPKWADLKAIRLFYFNCPSGHHVDHIIPLNGHSISGLHIIGNLQYLLATENLKKSKKI